MKPSKKPWKEQRRSNPRQEKENVLHTL